MWATVGAALKKIAVALLGNPKVLKTIGGIVLGLIIIIVMPVVAIVSIFNGDIEIDANELQRIRRGAGKAPVRGGYHVRH